MSIESVYNTLYETMGNHSEWNNSVWNRGLLHFKIENIFPKKKEPISWSYSFWLSARAEVKKENEVDFDGYESDSRDSFDSSKGKVKFFVYSFDF
jgi:hypothetical protein